MFFCVSISQRRKTNISLALPRLIVNYVNVIASVFPDDRPRSYVVRHAISCDDTCLKKDEFDKNKEYISQTAVPALLFKS